MALLKCGGKESLNFEILEVFIQQIIHYFHLDENFGIKIFDEHFWLKFLMKTFDEKILNKNI
jgi:hypothetical protein